MHHRDHVNKCSDMVAKECQSAACAASGQRVASSGKPVCECVFRLALLQNVSIPFGDADLGN